MADEVDVFLTRFQVEGDELLDLATRKVQKFDSASQAATDAAAQAAAGLAMLAAGYGDAARAADEARRAEEAQEKAARAAAQAAREAAQRRAEDAAIAARLVGPATYSIAPQGESPEHIARDFYELARAEDRATDATRAFDAALEQALAQTRASQAMARMLNETAESAENLGRKARVTSKDSQAGARAMLDFGRAAQDLAQGGLPAVINNLEGLGYNLTTVAKEGMSFKQVLASPAGIAGALTLVSTLIYVLGPKVVDFFASFGEGAEKVKLNTDKLEGFKDELSDVNKKLDDYKDATSLNNQQLAEANKLLGERARLEGEVARETERRKRAEALGNLKSPEQERQEKAQGAGLKSLAGQQEQLIAGVLGAQGTARLGFLNRQQAELQQALEASQRQQRLAVVGGGDGRNEAEQTRQIQENLNRINQAINAEQVERRAQATDIVARAFQGDEGALGAMRQAMARNPNGFTEQQRDVLGRNFVQDAMVKRLDKVVDDFGKRFDDAMKKQVESNQRRWAKSDQEFDEALARREEEAATEENDPELSGRALSRNMSRRAQRARDAARRATAGANEAAATRQGQAQQAAAMLGAQTPLDEMAAREAARLRAKGLNDPVELISRLRQGLMPMLQRFGVNAGIRGDVASEMARTAAQQTNQAIQERQAQLMTGNISAQNALRIATMQTVQQLTQEAASASMAAGQAIMGLHTLQQQSKVRTQTLQRRAQFGR